MIDYMRDDEDEVLNTSKRPFNARVKHFSSDRHG